MYGLLIVLKIGAKKNQAEALGHLVKGSGNVRQRANTKMDKRGTICGLLKYKNIFGFLEMN